MPDHIEEFQDAWVKFLKNVEDTASKKIQQRDPTYRDLGEPLENVVSKLREEKASDRIKTAVSELAQENRGEEVLALLVAELQFFNSLSTQALDQNSEVSLEETLEAAQDIKDSASNILGWTGWLQKLLDILDELLSILS